MEKRSIFGHPIKDARMQRLVWWYGFLCSFVSIFVGAAIMSFVTWVLQLNVPWWYPILWLALAAMIGILLPMSVAWSETDVRNPER